MRLALTLTLAAVLLAACPSSADAQTDSSAPAPSSSSECAAPRICTTGEAINAAADTLCRRARTAELRLDALTDDLAAVQAQRDVCHGRLLQLVETREAPPARAPLWLRVSLDVAVGALATTAGALAGAGVASEAVVGVAVAGAGALLARVVLEIVW